MMRALTIVCTGWSLSFFQPACAQRVPPFEPPAFTTDIVGGTSRQDILTVPEGTARISPPTKNSSQLTQAMSTGRNGLPSKGYLWMSVEAVFGKYSDSNALIGDERAPQSFSERFQAVNLGALDGAHIGAATLDPSLIGQQVNNDSVFGTRVRVGYRGDNNGGLEFDGLWMADEERSWQRGLGGLNAGADPTTVRVTAALPLYDGGAGYAVPFDQHFRIGLETRSSSYGLHFTKRGYWWGAVLLQPTLGVRYLQLDESFGFSAADSGLTYTHNDDGTPVETSLDPPQVAFPPYQAALNAIGETRLIGPLLGLSYSSTGKFFRFGGSTRAGVMFAQSEQTLNGQGFGNGFAAGFDPTITFNDTHDSNYATAMIEQNLTLDIDLLGIVPPFSRLAGDDSLVLRLGWSIMALHSVVRPVESTRWNGFPLSPELKNSRNDWYLQTWSVGAIFQY